MNQKFQTIDGYDYAKMFLAGSYELNKNVNFINSLNVFPVPDGDTGTNMNLTISSGIDELRKKPSIHIGEVSNSISKGLLLGARGNSGVILSQLFRGFAKSIIDEKTINAEQFIFALQKGVEAAYNAVINPVEGTMLTVSRESAHYLKNIDHNHSICEVIQVLLEQAKLSLSQTPEKLPILKQVGVVDAGGQGLVFIYQGFLNALQSSETLEEFETKVYQSSLSSQIQDNSKSAKHIPSQINLSHEDIKYGYCTEFILNLENEKIKKSPFDEINFREKLISFGDSLVVVADENWVKVHIHAEYPGEVMNQAMNYGSLSRIKIENMREQHSKIIEDSLTITHDIQDDYKSLHLISKNEQSKKKFGFISVVTGEGIAEIFKSLGVDYMVAGGQTMNPSIEEILNAINLIDADHIFILPNNSNIILAAQQASSLTLDKNIYVIPSKTIPQGISAMISFRDDVDSIANVTFMTKALEHVKSGQITVAVRDSQIDGIEIKKGSYIAIQDGKIIASEKTLNKISQKLITYMIDRDDSIVTLLAGEGADNTTTEELVRFINATFPHLEVEIHIGGQAVYPYLVGVE